MQENMKYVLEKKTLFTTVEKLIPVWKQFGMLNDGVQQDEGLVRGSSIWNNGQVIQNRMFQSHN
jgi:hypothetical protein